MIPVSQRIVETTIASKERYVVGNNTAPYFLVRDASNTVLLELERSKGGVVRVEVKRNDTLEINDFSSVALINPHDVEVVIHYQLADIPIGRQNDELDVTGAVDVNEIKEPVTVDVINSPIKLESDTTVNIGEMPPIEIDSDASIKVSELPPVEFADDVELSIDSSSRVFVVPLRYLSQTVQASDVITFGSAWWDTGALDMTTQPNGSGWIACAPLENKDPIFLFGAFPVYPGERIVGWFDAMRVNASGTEGDKVQFLVVNESSPTTKLKGES